MNYQRIYNQIIEKRKLEIPHDCYTEMHHIVPRSLGGIDESENLVRLTAREHFICHYLLTKMYQENTFKWYKTNNAFMMMKCQSIYQDRYFNSRLYEALRGNFSSIMSFIQSGSKNSQYGKVRCVPINAVNCKKHVGYLPDQIPEGWITTKDWKIKHRHKSSEKGMIKGCFCLLDKKKEIDELWNAFINNNYKSINEFSKSNYCNISQPALIKMFKKYIPEYSKIFTQGKSYIREA